MEVEDFNLLKKGLKQIVKELSGMHDYFKLLPEKMGNTFEHMKAVLDGRYQSMLKGFMNCHNKIQHYSLKLRNMESNLTENK